MQRKTEDPGPYHHSLVKNLRPQLIKFIVSQAIFCLIGMRASAIYYIFLLINDLCTNTYNTKKECSQGLELQEIVIRPL